MTSDDDDLDDASMKSMRAVWLSMRDEEPSTSGMSALLAAARDRAEQMQAKPTWWQRALVALRRPPALAFATVLVLIGGAVVVTRSTNKPVDSMVSDPSAADEPAAPASIAERPPAQAQPAAVPAPAPVAAGSAVAIAPNDAIVTNAGPAGGRGSERNRTKPRPTAKPPSKTTAASKGAGPGAAALDEAPESEISATKSEPRAPPAQDPSTPAAPPSRRSDPKTGEDVGADTVLSAQPAGQPQPPSNESLAKQAESAAGRNDCAAVRGLVARIKNRDEGFYKSRLAKNPAILKCL